MRRKAFTIHRNSTSLPEAVREILTRNYPVYQCLKMKLMNFRSLAEFIQPQVQQLSGKEASINTLVVAIKRFSDTLANDKTPDTSRVLKDARISLSSGIVDVTIRVPRNQFSTIVRELSDIAGELSEFPHIFPLSNSIKLILPAEDYALVHGKMGHLKEGAAQTNVAKVILNLSPHAEMKPGIAPYVPELSVRNCGSSLHAFWASRDIIIEADDQDGPLTYDVLQREIQGPKLRE